VLGTSQNKDKAEDSAAENENQTMRSTLQLCVDDSVTPNLLPTDRRYSLERTIKENMIAQEYSGEIIQLSAPRDELVYPSPKGLVDVATMAYNQHHDLVWRPDDVWQAILTQFSLYVTKNSEELRDQFVDFEGKKKLEIFAFGTLRTVDFGRLAERMVDEQIVNNIRDSSIAQWILPEFTTTTKNDRIVASVTLMATLQEYFEYGFVLTCGLPSITLLGSTNDWKLLRQKIDRLQEFDNDNGEITKWHKLLSSVLDMLIKTKSGIDNRSFWQKICHYSSGSGVTQLSGWITVFAVFNKDGEWQGDERILTNGPSGSQRMNWPVIDLSNVPSGAISVPVSIDDNGVHYDAHMMAGQFAFDGEGTSMQPRSDWCIAIDNDDDPVSNA